MLYYVAQNMFSYWTVNTMYIILQKSTFFVQNIFYMLNTNNSMADQS